MCDYDCRHKIIVFFCSYIIVEFPIDIATFIPVTESVTCLPESVSTCCNGKETHSRIGESCF